MQDAESSDSSESEDTTAALPAAKRQRLHRDGTASTATEAEQAIAAALAKDRWGRFGGRDGKMARIRAQERLASAAAAAAAAAAEAAATTSAAGNTQPPSSPADAAVHPVNDAAGSSAAQSPPESDAQPAEAKRRLAGKKAKRAAAEEAQTAAVSASVEHAAAPKPRKRRKGSEPAAGLVVPAPDSDRSTSEQALAPKTWWGASRFVSSGCMTGLQRDGAAPAAQPRVEFSESTQVRVWTDLPHNPCLCTVLSLEPDVGCIVPSGSAVHGGTRRKDGRKEGTWPREWQRCAGWLLKTVVENWLWSR